MRKVNAIVSMGMFLMFLIHAAMGSLQLAGLIKGGSAAIIGSAFLLFILMLIHIVIGIKLLIDTKKAVGRSGASYFKENKLFWIRRISGAAIVIFMALHVMYFTGGIKDSVFRFLRFGALQLTEQLLLVLSVAVHVITNIKPLMLAFGGKDRRETALDILLVLSAILLLSAAGFVIYFIRWAVF